MQFNLDDVIDGVADRLTKQSLAQGGNPISKEEMYDTFNGSNLSAITEKILAAVMKGRGMGSEQTNYDVILEENSKDHWAKKLEQRNMTNGGANLGPSTTAGHNRYFEILKAIEKWDDCDSLVVYDLESDSKNIDIYEIPAKLVAGLWRMNVIGQEVKIKKVPQGYRSAMVTYNRFKQLFPIEDYRYIINKNGHKMKDETPEECWRKAQERGHTKLKPCVKTFDFNTVDYRSIFDAN